MSVRRRGGFAGVAIGALAALALGVAARQSALAQSRTLAMLADVSALVPAPYHPPQSVTAIYSAMLYDHTPYYGGGSQSGGAHYWH